MEVTIQTPDDSTAPPTKPPVNYWTPAHTVGIFATVIAIPLVCWIWIEVAQPVLAWLSTFLLLWIFLLIAGNGVMGVWRGLVIDQRNVMSLSRMQMAMWTVIVVSGYLTGVLWNIFVGLENPLAISIPAQVWGLLGIGTASLVGTPLILSTKKEKTPRKEEMDAFKEADIPKKSRGQMGTLYRNQDIKDAEWADIVTGDEVGNAAYLDLSKVQMFFFTLIIGFAYCAALVHAFGAPNAEGIDAFPYLDESMVALLGISHAGYLAVKSSPHTATKLRADDDAAQQP